MNSKNYGNFCACALWRIDPYYLTSITRSSRRPRTLLLAKPSQACLASSTISATYDTRMNPYRQNRVDVEGHPHKLSSSE